jgi:hypothetical protein
MASFIYDSANDDLARGNINYASDTFYVMLATSGYTPAKKTDLKRSAVSPEVTGTGYVAGGQTSGATVVKDTTNDRQTVTFAGVSWSTATITARYAVYYKHRGGASSADELIGVNDFGADVTSTAGTFTLPSATLTIQN